MTYKLNTHIFDAIETEAQAYCLGYFYARASGHIQLRHTDYSTLSIISSILEYDGPIRTYDKVCEINIGRKDFTNKLISLGCQLNCRHMSSLPDLQHTTLFRHFLRAIFENYGRFYLVKQKYLNVTLNFNEQFIQELRQLLRQQLKIDTKHFYKYSHTNTLQMLITNRECAKKFLDYIYNDAFYYMTRKYLKYRKYLENGV